MLRYALLQSHISGDFGQRCKVPLFLPKFSTSSSPFTLAFRLQVKTIHKIDLCLLISLEMLVKSFASSILIDLSYNLNKYTQYKHVKKLFEVGCLHQDTVITLNRLAYSLLTFSAHKR